MKLNPGTRTKPMTNLRIDMKKFRRQCEEIRQTTLFGDDDTLSVIKATYRAKYSRLACVNYYEEPKTDSTAADLRAELVTASLAAGLYGATNPQIDKILALSVDAKDFTGLGCGRLTKAEASRIIDQMRAV